MTNKPITDGYSAPGVATGPSIEARPWPVLARIPWVVTEDSAQAEAPPSWAALETTALHREPALQIAEPSLESLRYELPPAGAVARRGAIEGRTFIDQPHLAVRGFDWPAGPDAGTVASPGTAVHHAASEQPILRIDRGGGFPAGEQPPPTPHPSFAAKVFQAHAAMAPHAGIVMTAAMAISVALLCWLTMGRSPSASSSDGSLPSPGAWRTETAAHTLPVHPAPSVHPLAEDREWDFAWRVAPRVEPTEAAEPVAEEASENTNESAEAAAEDMAAITAPELTLAEPSAATPEPSEKASAVAAAAPPVETGPEPITPTPNSTAYPTTPYGEFDYMAVGPGDAPAAMAPSR